MKTDGIANFLIILILTLIQVTVFPINFALGFLIGQEIFTKKFQLIQWVLLLSLLVSLFGNLTLGIVIIAFCSTIMAILLIRIFLPENQFTKIALVILTLPLANISLLTIDSLFK